MRDTILGQSGMSQPGWEGLQINDDGLAGIRLGFELVDYWPELAILDESAKNCDFCKLIRSQLKKATFPAEFERGRLCIEPCYYFENKDNRKGGLSLSGLIAAVRGDTEDGAEPTTLTFLRFTLDAVEGRCRRWLHLEQTPPSEFLTGENISKITARLKNSHKKPAAFLPTRLLDLACHGKPPMFSRLVTKEEVYNECHTFPMVFGVRYLWVDALCIVQGDSQDWERESANMGNIFRNSYFTIGAASIQSCNESFLSQTIDTLDIPFVSHIDPRVRGTYRLTARHSSHISLIYSNFLEDTSGPWRDRGWVFQETTLSPRLLVFGSTTVRVDFGEKPRWDRRSFFRAAEKTLDHASWRWLVLEYSGKYLTYEQDVFPAISGLARLYKERLGDQYLAGLWRKDLYLSLFFDTHVIDPSGKKSFSQRIDELESHRPYVAPSWSWAAHNRAVKPGCFGDYPFLAEYNATSECSVADARCDVNGLDPFGVVVHGYVVIAGKTLRPEKNEFLPVPNTRLYANLEGFYDWCLEGQGPVMLVHLDGVLDGKDDRRDDLVFLLLGSSGDMHAPPFCDESTSCSSNDECLSQEREDSIQGAQSSEDCSKSQCLEQVGWLSSSSMSEGGTKDSSEEERTAYGLVLCPAKGINKFYRIGAFISEFRNEKPYGGMRFCEDWGVETVEII
ncbi:heterokaryon incompatibility protein [Fusarium heterosporum]|uniref:Heterokaryon incompatibility protein n=1 Tax=Fusarium heterosporum TaxID=42747 RepID=A0A8H5TL26_FUSHE|nr:heterokaryon incompatibility protein [Fusarium heterosporum]